MKNETVFFVNRDEVPEIVLEHLDIQHLATGGYFVNNYIDYHSEGIENDDSPIYRYHERKNGRYEVERIR